VLNGSAGALVVFYDTRRQYHVLDGLGQRDCGRALQFRNYFGLLSS
jgi:hypothetical protein